MTMTVKTQSGSIYFFTQKDGRTFFQRGSITGEVIRITNGSITIGRGIEMDIRKNGLYGNPDDCTMPISTTPVVKMSVIL